MDFIISLAHFCEGHGPTFIFCTEASHSPCSICNPCITPPSEEIPRPTTCSYTGLYDHPSVKLADRLPQLSSPFETPPTSPRSPSSFHNSYFPSFPGYPDSDASSRRPSFETDGVCDNCSFVVPSKSPGSIPTGASPSPSKSSRGRDSCPVLRTTKEVSVWGPPVPIDEFSSSPDLSDMSDTDRDQPERSAAMSRSASSFPESEPGSPTFAPRGTHTHTLNFISSGQPQSPAKYSLLRRSSIRTLSCEMLPTGKPSGPIMFGDPVAGYTIAYIFRLQDPRARGQRRTYALIALAGRDSRRASGAMVKITEVFENIANRIVTLAERVLERESGFSRRDSRPGTAVPTTPPLSSSAATDPVLTLPQRRMFSSVASAPTSRNITPVSSFLTAKKVDPDGYPRVSREVMDAKPLTEIVGKDNFFVELHGLFCGILASLIQDFGRRAHHN